VLSLSIGVANILGHKCPFSAFTPGWISCPSFNCASKFFFFLDCVTHVLRHIALCVRELTRTVKKQNSSICHEANGLLS